MNRAEIFKSDIEKIIEGKEYLVDEDLVGAVGKSGTDGAWMVWVKEKDVYYKIGEANYEELHRLHTEKELPQYISNIIKDGDWKYAYLVSFVVVFIYRKEQKKLLFNRIKNFVSDRKE